MIPIEQFLGDVFDCSSRLVILGVGSELMADDAAGTMIAESLMERFSSKVSEKLLILSGSNAPECFTGVIKDFKPSHVILIDAADFKGQPGECCDIDPTVVCGVSFSTHMLPLKVMLEYLKKETGCETVILGIQPKCLEFCGEMTAEVKKTVDTLIEILSGLIKTKK